MNATPILNVTAVLEKLAAEMLHYGTIVDDTLQADGAIRNTTINYYGEKFIVSKFKGDVVKIAKIG